MASGNGACLRGWGYGFEKEGFDLEYKHQLFMRSILLGFSRGCFYGIKKQLLATVKNDSWVNGSFMVVSTVMIQP